MAFFYVRIGIYIAVTLIGFQVLITAVVHSSAPAAFFRDDGPWEWVEFSFVAVSGAILLINARVTESYRPALQLFGLLAVFAAVRELDQFLDALAFKGAYKLINGPILAFFGYLVWKYRRTLAGTLADFCSTAPFYFMFLGWLIVVVYAQLMGQQELWQAIMGDSYIRSVKRASEEILEILGYWLILFGAVETFFLKDRQQ